MNWILPAYETMWRVVIRCFLEIKYRRADDGGKWSHVLTDYLETIKNPKAYKNSPKLFRAPVLYGIAPIHVVKEALPLYPPTRRVHREFNGKTFAANIEECHLLEILCEGEPKVFKPERWQSMDKIIEEEKGSVTKDKEGKYGFMPFAFRCPAGGSETRGFGFKMIGLLVATLCHEIGEAWQVKGEHGLLDREQPLSSDRAAYGELELERKL